ncbi:MAG: energy coupling factor transporter S component ThiW [Bacillota bacterium]|nr:energy coupling factor transporter S component ThiW [Bacillota bacterium]
MKLTKKLTLASLFVAIGVIFSGFSIPIGFAKVFPIQHMINLLGGVLLGPLYSVLIAFVTSVIRVSMGTGTLLAFPGSMFGALLVGLLYHRSHRLSLALIGEVVGTGLIGALIAYPVALYLMGREVAMIAYLIPFSLSSFAGAIVGYIGLRVLLHTPLGRAFHMEYKVNHTSEE